MFVRCLVFVISFSLPLSISHSLWVCILFPILSPLRLYAFIIYLSDLFQREPKNRSEQHGTWCFIHGLVQLSDDPLAHGMLLRSSMCFLNAVEILHCDLHQPQQHPHSQNRVLLKITGNPKFKRHVTTEVKYKGILPFSRDSCLS